jgi:hypothetical protein
MTTVLASAMDTQSAATVRRVRGGFGLIPDFAGRDGRGAALGEWKQERKGEQS